MRHITAAVLGLAVALGLPAGSALAQAYPSKPVRIVVGFSPSGPVDSLARLLARKLGDAMGQQFIVDNKPGASAMIGAQFVARAEPDGYTLLMVAATHAVNPSLYKKMSYDTEKDFAPISLVSESPFVLVVPAKLPVKTVPELISYAKKENISYASAGVGGLPHLSAELFKTATNLEANHVPYKGAAPATVDLLAGHVAFMFNNMLSALPSVRDGRLRALAVTTRQRSPALPDVPTIGELGFGNYDVSGWYGLLAPAGTSPAIVAKLNAEVNRILRDPEVIKSLEAEGMTPSGSTPQALNTRIQQDIVKWAAVVKASGATAE